MSGFLYYLPQMTQAVRLEDLPPLGLGYVFSEEARERSFTSGNVSGGPDGDNGVVVADSARVARVGYYPDEQNWRQMPASMLPKGAECRPWVGMFIDDPPAPDDLMRKSTLDGRWVQLNDGRQWLAPLARGWNSDDNNPGWYQALPQATGLDDLGNWELKEVVPKHVRLWQLALRFWDEIAGADDVADGEIKFDFAGQNDAALMCLQTNYRINKLEAAMLGLFTDANTTEILFSLVDWWTFLEWQKKKHNVLGPL